MKFHIGFIAILLTALSIFGYLALTFNERDLFFFHGANQDVGQFLTSFRQAHKPVIEINFSALYGRNGQFQVLHPLLNVAIPTDEQSDFSCRGTGFANEMQKVQANLVRAFCPTRATLADEYEMDWLAEGVLGKSRSKRDTLEHFLNEGAKLPEDFLTTPPFIDSWGYSYAYRLSNHAVARFSEKSWVERNLSFFKVSELKEILGRFNIVDPEYSTIARLDDHEIEDVIRGTPFIMTKDYLLFKNQSRFGFSPLSYWVYDIQDLHTDLKGGKYEFVSYSPDALCLQRIGNVCWTYSSRHALMYLYRYSLATLILVGLVFFTFLCLYLRRLYEKTKEQRKHRLALQVLSHEFRTPVSSMLLLIDQLRSHLAKFDLSDQDLITRLSTDAFRLQRIVEVSKTYLQAESHRIHFKYVEIPSINAWIDDFIAESNLEIQLHRLDVDQCVRADPFWLKFILSNLVQNAFSHGKPPVAIRLENRKSRFKITVEDQGTCEFQSLSQMTDAFVKSSRSHGMGLGLNIAKFIVEEWGSEIQFSNSPTAFSLSLSNLSLNKLGMG